MALRSSSFSYDVFLSFRGSDTRQGFTGNLYKALYDKGIHTFIDDEKLQRGEEITPSLEKAIHESRIAIIVLSENYASSSFCLDELATIIDCKSKGMLVIPVFYKVDPSDIRHHKGSYGEALAKHEERFKHKMDKLQKWKMALHQVSNISGYHLEDRDEYEYKFIGSIVALISEKINHPARLHVGDYLVGIESRVTEVMKLLDVGSDDGVHMIGIYGMGGIGKSTLAQAVYNNLIVQNFDGLCFLENVREESKNHGLKQLQKVLLQKILREKEIDITSVKEGASMIQNRLQRKKVLLILDDIDNSNQLEAIVGRPDWFGPGSIVIITTRDKHLLKSHKVERRYEVKKLNLKNALQLLTWKAFKKDKVDPTYEEVLSRVVTYASGLPLALEVIGSSLFQKSIDEWESAIDQYRRIPHDEIHNILKVSYDALQDEEKSVFLDIACCLKGFREVEDILHAHYGHSMKYHIGMLVEKSLIKHSYYGTFAMHDLIEDMGQEIVRQKSRNDPGKRSRLRSAEDIRKVLEDNTGTSEIEMMCVDFSILEEEIEWDGNAFQKMTNLKTLIIRHGIFSEAPKILPKSLRVLEWWGYPSNSLPFYFHPKELAICKLPRSRFMSLEFGGSSKKFVNLTTLNFDECKHLTRISDLSCCPNLGKLSFNSCPNLVTVHESVGFLDKLKILSAEYCSKLESFPPIKLTSLEELELSKCLSLESFPEILGKMENITSLRLTGTPIKELPVSFQYLFGLKYLFLDRLPSSIVVMTQLTQSETIGCKGGQWVEQEEDEKQVFSKLQRLYVTNCNLKDDFFSIGFTRFHHVEHLDLSENNFTILPECIKEFQFLHCLNVSDCKHLQEIKGLPPNLAYFSARNCKSLSFLSRSMLINQELYKAELRMINCKLPGACVPEWFDQKSRGPSTSFWYRNYFPHNVLCFLIAPVEYGEGSLLCPAPRVIINGKVCKPLSYYDAWRTEMDHTYIFHLVPRILFERDFDDVLEYVSKKEVPLENKWNHVEVTYVGEMESSLIKATGIHLFKKESNNEDIRFTDPYSKTKSDWDLNSSGLQTQPLLKKRRFVMPILKFHRYKLCINQNKKRKMNRRKKNEQKTRYNLCNRIDV